MAPTHTLTLQNGTKSTDMKIRMEVNGVIENNGSAQITMNVADETKTIDFRGSIREFTVIRGEGSCDINGKSIRFQDLPGYDTRTGDSSGGDSGGGDSTSGGGSSGGSSSGSDGTPSYQGTPDGTISSAAEYANFFELPIPNTKEFRVGIEPGTYNPPAIQRSILHARPEYSIQVLGTEDPYKTDISRANHNFTILCKDEHFWVEGMTWGRTQFSGAGDPYCKHMVFTDRRGKHHSALGGKRASGRFIGCDIGHKHAPDEYAAYYFGGGTVHFDRGNAFRATGDAYIGVNNTATLYIDGSNDWLSGDKEIVEGSGVYPNDLDNGVNIIDAGKLHDEGWL